MPPDTAAPGGRFGVGVIVGSAGFACAAIWACGGCTVVPIVDEYRKKFKEKREAAKLFASFDLDHDGRVDIDELRKGLQDMRTGHTGGHTGGHTPRVNDALAAKILTAADRDGSGSLTEAEFVQGITPELSRIRSICAVPDKCTPFQIAFTIPEQLLDSPADRRISGSLHIRIRLGVVISGSRVDWDAWQNPLSGSSNFQLEPRVRDEHGQALDKLPPIVIMDSRSERNWIFGSGAAPQPVVKAASDDINGTSSGSDSSLDAQAPGHLRHFIIKGLVPSCTNLLVCSDCLCTRIWRRVAKLPGGSFLTGKCMWDVSARRSRGWDWPAGRSRFRSVPRVTSLAAVCATASDTPAITACGSSGATRACAGTAAAPPRCSSPCPTRLCPRSCRRWQSKPSGTML